MARVCIFILFLLYFQIHCVVAGIFFSFSGFG
jgi:hypothetical protein